MDSNVSRRTVLAVATTVALFVASAGTPAFAKPKAKKAAPATMIPITVVDLRLNAQGNLVADLRVGQQLVQNVPVNLDLSPDSPQNAECPILDLELGPINLDLLGLNVETSAICLEITAVRGALLGDLLCSIAGLLDGGLDLGDILGGLDLAVLNSLLDALTDLLNGGLAAATAPNANTAVSSSQAGACDILNLSVGPLELNLLGLEVMLDDCEGGPVTIDITAERGRGNLLGNLLCNLAGLLDGPANDNAINNALGRVAAAILRLLAAA